MRVRPGLGIRFALTEGREMRGFYPDSSRFLTIVELRQARFDAAPRGARGEWT